MTDTLSAAGAGAADVSGRASDLILARVHLRLGSLELARAELETLAGHDALDDEGLVDLAEARWRTGDIEGAGEAAMAALHDDDGPILALVVAAEAAAARGRPTEARRYVERAMRVANGSIDTIFAGMPRGPAWPPDPAAPPPAPTTMFDPPHGPGRSTSRPTARPAEPTGAVAPAPTRAPTGQPVDATPSTETATIAMWDDTPIEATPVDDAVPAEVGPPPEDDHLVRGRAALEAGDVASAAVSLSLVLRLNPVLAPSVIDLVAGRSDPRLAFVRGDAYRLVGRELDALSAYGEVARPAGPSDDVVPDDPPQGDPA